MELGYQTGGLDNFYEVIHAWANQEYFKKCGVNLHVLKTLEKNDIKKKKGFISQVKQLFVKNHSLENIKKKYEVFVNSYIDNPDSNLSGKTFDYMEYTFGSLVIPKDHILEEEEEELGGNYLSSVILLNQADYLKFVHPVDEKSSYILTYIEHEEIYKTDYINRFIIKEETRQVFIGEYPKNYINARHYDEAGPLDIISLLYYADGIITDSLTILELALVFHKDFIYMNGGRGEGKAALLLEQMGLGNHFVHDPTVKSLSVRYKTAATKILWNRILRVRKAIIKNINILFPGLETDALDACECPTGITRTGCYGCLACKEICPKGAITMINDLEEFLFPFTDYKKCNQCGLCKNICIRNKQSYLTYEEGFPTAVCARHKDEETLFKSTSGAVFPALAKYAIEEKKGVVVGVKYGEDVIDVISDIAETMEDVEAFYGSKYVKSNFDGIFPRVKKLLSEDRYVLYSGLPCECAGLRSYLRKDYDNLFICEILCHSVPSPKVYRRYIKYLQGKRKSKVTNLVFRQKTETFPKMVITYRKGTVIQARYARNNYFRAFHNDFISRTSCSKCEFTYNHRAGDVTIGDFWGVEKVYPDLADKKGLSCILINTEKGKEVYENISGQFDVRELTFKQAFIKNHKKPKPLSPEREELFRLLEENVQINKLLESYNDMLEKPEIKPEAADDPETQIIEADSVDNLEPEVLLESDVNENDDDVLNGSN